MISLHLLLLRNVWFLFVLKNAPDTTVTRLCHVVDVKCMTSVPLLPHPIPSLPFLHLLLLLNLWFLFVMKKILKWHPISTNFVFYVHSSYIPSPSWNSLLKPTIHQVPLSFNWIPRRPDWNLLPSLSCCDCQSWHDA